MFCLAEVTTSHSRHFQSHIRTLGLMYFFLPRKLNTICTNVNAPSYPWNEGAFTFVQIVLSLRERKNTLGLMFVCDFGSHDYGKWRLRQAKISDYIFYILPAAHATWWWVSLGSPEPPSNAWIQACTSSAGSSRARSCQWDLHLRSCRNRSTNYIDIYYLFF